MKKSLLAATILTITSIANAATLSETLNISIPPSANPGFGEFTGLGLAPADVTAIDIAFTNGLGVDVTWEVTKGNAAGLNVSGNSEIRIDSFTGLPPHPPCRSR